MTPQELAAALAEATEAYVDRMLAELRTRLAAVEARPAVPGPPGPPGKPGLTYQGWYQHGQAYDLGDVVHWGGSAWHCDAPTTTKPGDGSKEWSLLVKKGSDGRPVVKA